MFIGYEHDQRSINRQYRSCQGAKTHTTVAFSAYNATVMINKVSRATFLSDFIAEEGQKALYGDISGRKRSPGGMLTYSNLSRFGKIRKKDYF